jgi:hypothetical protein
MRSISRQELCPNAKAQDEIAMEITAIGLTGSQLCKLLLAMAAYSGNAAAAIAP